MQQHKKIESLMLFVEIAQQLSFTKAADNLSISNGYLSDQIKKLEKEFKCPLLVRTTRSVRLTPQGKKVFAQGKAIKASMLNIERSIERDHDALEGVIKITAPKMFTDSFLLNLCDAFQKIHPKIRFSIDSTYTNHDLNEDDFDLAFRATVQPQENMVAKKLLTYQHCLCAAPSYLETHGYPENVEDLANHQCLTSLAQPFWPLKQGNIPVQGWLTINENSLLKKMALEGKGIIRIADYYVRCALQQGRLQQLLTEHYIAGQSIYLLYPQSIYPTAKLRAFTTFVEAQCAIYQQEYSKGKEQALQ